MLPVLIPSGPRPLPFYHALQYRYGELDVGVVREAALETERRGYHSVWVSDHLSREVCRERLECWTTISARESFRSLNWTFIVLGSGLGVGACERENPSSESKQRSHRWILII